MQVQTLLSKDMKTCIKTFPKGLCCTRCYQAKSDKKKCRCRCGGTFHGLAHEKHDPQKEDEEAPQ